MDLRGMADKAKQVFQQRGGAKAAKEDAQELRDISHEQGSIADKLKDAAGAIKEPGAPGRDSPGRSSAGGRRRVASHTSRPARKRAMTAVAPARPRRLFAALAITLLTMLALVASVAAPRARPSARSAL